MSVFKNRRSMDNIEWNLRRQNQNKFSRKSFQTKKLKTLLSLYNAQVSEINSPKQSPFHLIDDDDEYRKIEKNIQNQILKLSMTIIGKTKFDEIQKQKTKKVRQSNVVDINTLIQRANTKGKFNLNLIMKKRSHNLESIKKFVHERNRRIKKVKKLHDSSGEDESEKEKEQGDYGINPRSIFIDIFDFALLISCGFCLFYLPVRLAVTKMIIENNEYVILFLIHFSELLYIMDFIFGFLRWFYNNEFKMVTNMYMIISHYFSTDFTLDLIMAVPFFTILRFQKVVKYDYKLMYNERYSWLKILMCLKAFKIFKLNHVKNNRVVYYFNRKFSKNYFVEKIYQMFNFILLMLSMFNFIICLHIYMAEQSYPNWIVETNLQNKSFFDVYFASFYFIIATMTSVGYGDITCVSMEETYFQIILLTIGLVAYSFIISTVGDYVKNQSRANMNYNRDMNKLEEIRIAYPNMPFKLYKKIQQHIRRTLTQSKKYEYNILINSLPYYLQNSILLQIHKNEINNFRFFKHCDNSDFILKVLTHFIPIFSKQNIVLVGEGELFENIFFVKNGRLCLEAIIDLDEIKYSIEKYLKYRFEEIDQIDELLDHENSLEKSRILSKSFRKGKVKNLKKLMEIITKQFEHIDDLAYMHESTIEQEIGQVDFHQEIHDFYKGNIKYIPILDLLKNEYFGDILMFLNIENPLSLRVKSKRVELYVLRKKDAFSIKKEYPNIWQRLTKKSIHNIKSLKFVTLNIIQRYCEMNGLIVRDNQVIRPRGGKNSINSINQITSKSMPITKLNIFKNRNSSLKYPLKNPIDNKTKKRNSTVKFHDRLSANLPQRKLMNIITQNKRESSFKKGRKKGSVSFSPNQRRLTIINNNENNDKDEDLSSSISFSLSERTINLKLNKYISEDDKKNYHNYNFHKKKKENEINMNIYSMKANSYMPYYDSRSLNFFKINSKNSNQAQIISNSNNQFIISKISSSNELNSNNSKNNFDYMIQETSESFHIKSSYKNINEVARGKYIKDHKFQNVIQKIVKSYVKAKKKDQNYFNSIVKRVKFKSNNTVISPKNNTENKNSINTEKNNNSLFNNIESRNSKSVKSPNIQNNIIHNKLKNQKSKEYIFSLSKGKYALESRGGKSVNSIKQLNLVDINKNQDLLSESNDFNISLEPLKENNIKYKYITNFTKKEQHENKSNLNEIVQIEKSAEKIYSGKHIKKKDGNSIHEVNLNYVNNFCCIY